MNTIKFRMFSNRGVTTIVQEEGEEVKIVTQFWTDSEEVICIVEQTLAGTTANIEMICESEIDSRTKKIMK